MRTRQIAFLGLMLSMVMVLVILERMLPPLPFLPPNFGIGLSNIIIMYLLFFAGMRKALMMAVLKASFSLLIRGPISGVLSLSGGVASVVVVGIFAKIIGKTSYTTLSILGAVAHNAAQVVVASFLLDSQLLLIYYSPVLLVVGLITGSLTGVTMKVIMPIFSRLYKD